MLLIINIWFALEVIFEDNVFIWRLGLQSKCQEGCLCLFCRKVLGAVSPLKIITGTITLGSLQGTPHP